ncbi:helix-turn-helix domain-containing protein [Nocardia rhamnosiphila]|uniref:HTH cro/C1-type domain-containing protein n=2 Tax=Nocardia rhamnosiphila TaxID=426716 RepID=A0ABV2WMH7_9NOCA|nr:transcriptional regulator [Nocardia rhamnosiphila]
MIVTRWTGVEVRALRTAALRVTQEDFAETAGFTVGVVRKWEGRRESIELSGKFAARMDDLLRDLGPDQEARFEVALSAPNTSTPAGGSTDSFENPAEILQRIQHLSVIESDRTVPDALALLVDDVVERYEFAGPYRLAPVVIDARRQLEAMLRQRRNPTQLRSLYAVAGRLAGILAYMAVNRGRFGHAKMYCKEALVIGELSDDAELRAWIKGTESFCAYYQGDYATAVRVAYEGLDAANDGPQSVRLYSNGLARALGKVGDAAGVAEAIDLAIAKAASLGTGPGLTPALSFDAYGEARLMANAATAFLSAGDFRRCLEFGERVEDYVAQSDSVWSHSLVRLDRATAMLGGGLRDIDSAAQLGIEALEASKDRPIRSVWQRAHEFGHAIEAIPSRASQAYLESLRTWSTNARRFSASEG